MSVLKQIDDHAPAASEELAAPERLLPLLGSVTDGSACAPASVIVGRLVGVRDYGRTPLVVFSGQAGTAAVAARSTVDVHAGHVGRPVILFLEQADISKPIIMGVLRGDEDASALSESALAAVEADGERIIVSARHQIVFQCGKASITLMASGKVLIQGTYVLTRSSGVNRIRGGSVQIN
jgi:hypothetical protein